MSSFSDPTVEQLSSLYPEFMMLHIYVNPLATIRFKEPKEQSADETQEYTYTEVFY